MLRSVITSSLQPARAAVRASPALGVRALHASRVAYDEKSALETRLRDGLKTAMKARDKESVGTLKSIIADVTYVVKSGANPNAPASQETVVTAIRKGIEKRKEAAEAYAPDSPQAAAFATEIALLQGYMPTAPTPEAVQALIDEIVAAQDARGKGNKATGGVMKALWERLGDARAAVDKKDVARRVAEALK